MDDATWQQFGIVENRVAVARTSAEQVAGRARAAAVEAQEALDTLKVLEQEMRAGQERATKRQEAVDFLVMAARDVAERMGASEFGFDEGDEEAFAELAKCLRDYDKAA